MDRVWRCRIAESYRQLGIKQTFFIPAWCIEQYSEAVETILKSGHEIAHHSYIHENPLHQSDEDEAHWLDLGIEIIARDRQGAARLARPTLQFLPPLARPAAGARLPL
jgi:peptidoglycan-N-acetylglucosamine deacetylase